MKNKIYIGILVLGVTLSCTEMNNSEENNALIQSETELASSIDNPHKLEKNDSRKWKVSKGMKKPLKKINKEIESFEGSALVDYQLLGDAISKQTSKLISGCDMTGQSHDELHKWLLPFLDLKDALVMASSPEEGAALLEHIKNELDIFDSYFK